MLSSMMAYMEEFKTWSMDIQVLFQSASWWVLRIYNSQGIGEQICQEPPPRIFLLGGEQKTHRVSSRFSRQKKPSQWMVESQLQWRSPPNIFWLVVFGHPSEKYEFVNWDDEIPNISGKIKLMATKPPTSIWYITISIRAHRQFLSVSRSYVRQKIYQTSSISHLPLLIPFHEDQTYQTYKVVPHS